MNGDITDWAFTAIHDGGRVAVDANTDTGTYIEIEAYNGHSVTGFTTYGDVLSLDKCAA